MSFVQLVDAGYVVTLEAFGEECFVIASPGAAGGTLYGDYDYLNDNLTAEPLSVVILDSKQEHVLYRSRRRATEGKFRITLKPEQKVNLCLQNGIITAGRGKKSVSNRNHDGDNRVVAFSYSVDAKDENAEIHSQNERNKRVADQLLQGLNNLRFHHTSMRTRETMHRAVVESTFSQLMWWLILEAITVIAIAGLQILYFKNFLERRRYM